MMTDDAITPPQATFNQRRAAEYLGVSSRQIQRWRDQGQLQYVRLGPRSIRYRRSDLDEFMRARVVQPVVVPMPMTR